MKPTTSSLDQIFATHIGTLALTLRPNSLTDYRCAAGRFLTWLHTAFPRVCRPSQLRRDPHLLAWFRHLCERQPPLSNQTRRCYLLCLRRMLDDLAANGHPIAPDLIRPEDFPPSPKYLPRPLSPQDDQLLQQELRRTNDLNANASVCLWIASGSWAPTHGLFMSRSASFTTNAWFPSMPTLGAPLRVLSNCVLWLQPRKRRGPGTSYCRVLVSVVPCITRFGWHWRMPPDERPAPVR